MERAESAALPPVCLMRFAPFAVPVVVLALADCGGCPPANPTPVTFEIDNTLNWPIFVADEQQQAGISVQLPVGGGTWADAPESLTCPCQACDQICAGNGCNCTPPAGVIRQIHPAASYQRKWSGQYHVKSSVSCFLGGAQTCLEAPTNAAPGQHLRAELCFANQLQTPPPSTDTFPGSIPQSNLQCVDREFTLPVSGVIVLSPPSAPNCNVTADCTGTQICQDGLCSTSCLPNQVPALSGTWSADVGDPDNQGFFTQATSTDRITLTGSGTVGSIQYTSGDVQIGLYRNDATLGRVTATMYITLPGGRAAPMAVGDSVDVTVIESTDSTRPGANAAVFRRSGVTLLVIDAGRGGPVLTPQDMQPFSVATEGEEFACDPGDCGRKIHRVMTFTGGGVNVALQPGTSQVQVLGGYSYEFVPVTNYKYDYAGCDPQPITPFVILLHSP